MLSNQPPLTHISSIHFFFEKIVNKKEKKKNNEGHQTLPAIKIIQKESLIKA